MKYEILTKCCSQQYCDCFANKDGYCTCLEDTEFPKSSVPSTRKEPKRTWIAQRRWYR